MIRWLLCKYHAHAAQAAHKWHLLSWADGMCSDAMGCAYIAQAARHESKLGGLR